MENSNKNISIEFKPSAKFLIRKNMKGILDVVLDEINDFKQSNSMKLKSLSVLFYLIKASGALLEKYVDKILNCLYSHMDSEEDLSKKCEETAEILGLCIDQNIILPIISKHLSEVEIKNSYQPMYCRLKLLSNVISRMANINDENVEMLLKLITQLDVFNLASENAYTKKILYYSFKLYLSLTINLGKNCFKYHENIFFPLLLLQSLPDTISFHQEVKLTMLTLAESCGFTTIEQLYSLELSCILEKFRDSHKTWRRNSPDRFAFDTYVRNGGIALDKHWIDILMIISFCCEGDKDIEMRIDMMILLENVIDNPELSDQIKSYIEFIFPEILIPSTIWKSLRTNTKVRKAALVCIIKSFKNFLIDASTAIGFFADILLILKSTLEDDWDPELRFLSLHVLKCLLTLCKDNINDIQLVDLYPHILKRLDDSQDTNRILACEVFTIFFIICQKVRISEGTYEFILKTAFIHLDDPNENVRRAVFNFLKEACNVKPHKETFKRIVDSNKNAFVHKSILKEFIDNE
jgi:dynein assembly factor 5